MNRHHKHAENIVGAPITSAMQQDDFEYLQVPRSHESLFIEEILSNQTEQAKVFFSLLSLSDACCSKNKDSIYTMETTISQQGILVDDDGESEQDLARLIERCDDDQTLAVSVLGAFIIQGAACCSELQQLLRLVMLGAGRQCHLQFRAVRN